MEEDATYSTQSPQRLKNKQVLSDFSEPAPFAARKVHLFMLNYSEYLGHVSTVDDMAILVVVPKNLLPSKLDLGLLYGLEASLMAGPEPLEVIRGEPDSSRGADYSYNTNVGGTVPPRLPRRPKLELFQGYLDAPPLPSSTQATTSVPATTLHQRKKTMTDELDKVMETARAEAEVDDLPIKATKVHRLPQRVKPLKIYPGQKSQQSKQLQLKATDKTPPKTEEPMEGGAGYRSSVIPDHVEHYNPGYADRPIQARANIPIQPEETQLQEQPQRSESNRSQHSHNRMPSQGSSILPPRPLAELVARARERLKRFSKAESFGIEEGTDFLLDARGEAELQLVILSVEDDQYLMGQASTEEAKKAAPKLRAPLLPGQQAASQMPPVADEDDEYYDIGDPVFIHNPAPQKRKQSRGKRLKKNELKPFSYATLVNLLESVNGTIIGEEFAKLNLPVKEKQLIEKIVDSLLRLTLDMVIDEHRYDTGIKRLEKALRVLEGFL